MQNMLTRRRFLAISASAGSVAAWPALAAEQVVWTGRAMGAPATLVLSGTFDSRQSRAIFRRVEHELARLERIFSLYRADSQISQLNAAGILRAPAPEFVELLELCDRLNRASGGAFDPTLQPLWLAHAKAATRGQPLSRAGLAQMRRAIGWSRLSYDADAIRFDTPGGGLTLNGVAQGYVTDRIADLLRSRGLDDVTVDMGEIAVLGNRAAPVGVAAPDGTMVGRITLSDRALATSAPMGTILDPETALGHIFDHREDRTPVTRRLVSVSAPSAAQADGLSTALCLLPDKDIRSCLSHFPATKLEILI